MGRPEESPNSDVAVTVANLTASVSLMDIKTREDNSSIDNPGAESVTSIVRSSATVPSAVTYSQSVLHSSPGSLQIADTQTPSRHPSVLLVSGNLTRPISSTQPTNSSLPLYPSQAETYRVNSSPKVTNTPQTVKDSSLNQPLQINQQEQNIVNQVLVPQQNPQPSQTSPTYTVVHQASTVNSLVTTPSTTSHNQSSQRYQVLQNLLLSLGKQQTGQQQQIHQSLSHGRPEYINHVEPVLNPSIITQQSHSDQIYIGPRYQPKTTSKPLTQQNQLVKQLLIRNLHLIQQQQQEKRLNPQQQPEGQQQLVLLDQQSSPLRQKSTPSHTVQYNQYLQSCQAVSQTLGVSIPVTAPPPYHSPGQRVPDVPILGINQSGDSGSPSPMTPGTTEPVLTSGKMESRPISSFDTLINTCGDISYPTDLIDASIYASSPNSLFMYDQEKMDMQSTLANSSTCLSVDTGGGIGEEFDLKAQYEVSQDLSTNLPLYVSTSSDNNVTFSLNYECGGGRSWDEGLKHQDDNVMLKSEITSKVTTPTLAELNFNLDLLEDIESVISVDTNSSSTGTQPDSNYVIKQEAGTSYDVRSMLGIGSPSASSPTYTKLVNTQPTQPVKTEVKTEPSDVKANVNETLNRMLQSTYTWSKAHDDSIKGHNYKRELSTIKQLDLSDVTTLRDLLVNQQATSSSATPTVRAPRKRTVSESATLKSVSTRKRSYPSAGLESMDRKWEEIKQFIHMDQPTDDVAPPTGRPSPVKRERRRYDSECSVVTLTSNEDDESDSDREFDDESDSDLDDGHDIGSLNPEESLIGEKDKQYFWQYNVQSKGPKGTRAHFEMEEDPHVLNDFEDPVFDPTNSNIAGVGVSIKHGGKARKGDGNDIVPSPKKLCQIGLQLRKINRQINDFLPVSELPSAERNKSRKEKNKLASRACRLKKKAQHEANKVKLHGLELEHRQLLTVIRVIQKQLMARLKTKVKDENQLSMTETLDMLINRHLTAMIGGNTTDYVNKVVHTVEGGDTTGGLNIQATRSYPKELHN